MHFTFAAGRAGHGIGLMSTEQPHVARYDHTTLREEMAITIEPGWVDQQLGTFVAEENSFHRGDRFFTRSDRSATRLPK